MVPMDHSESQLGQCGSVAQCAASKSCLRVLVQGVGVVSRRIEAQRSHIGWFIVALIFACSFAQNM